MRFSLHSVLSNSIDHRPVVFYDLTTFADYLIPKPSLENKNINAIYFISRRNKGIHTFRKGVTSKVNVIARLEFELTNWHLMVQHFSNYSNCSKYIPNIRSKIQEIYWFVAKKFTMQKVRFSYVIYCWLVGFIAYQPV